MGNEQSAALPVSWQAPTDQPTGEPHGNEYRCTPAGSVRPDTGRERSHCRALRDAPERAGAACRIAYLRQPQHGSAPQDGTAASRPWANHAGSVFATTVRVSATARAALTSSPAVVRRSTPCANSRMRTAMPLRSAQANTWRQLSSPPCSQLHGMNSAANHGLMKRTTTSPVRADAGTGCGLSDAASLSRNARTNCTVASRCNATSSARARSSMRMSAGLPRISDGGRGTAEHIGAQLVAGHPALRGALDVAGAFGRDALFANPFLNGLIGHVAVGCQLSKAVDLNPSNEPTDVRFELVCLHLCCPPSCDWWPTYNR